MNLDLLVSGFCVVFDEPSVDGRPAELRQDYDWFPGFADSLPLRVDHHVIVTSSGAYDAGRVGRFAIVEGSPPIPHGVLCLAECADNDIGQSVFEAVARGELWGFSLGGNGRAEISLYANCRVVGCGVHALAAWELLTGGGAASRGSRGCHRCRAQLFKRCPACTSSLRRPGARRRRHQVDA